MMIDIENPNTFASARSTICFTTTMSTLLCYSSLAVGALEGSVHDLRSINPTGELCNVCHTPHSDNNVLPVLWNHEMSTVEYTLYTSDTMYATPEQPGIGSVSRMCLSCHDGTVAIDSFANNPGNGNNRLTGIASKGTDLSDDHPVSILWSHQTQGYGSLAQCTNCHIDGDEPRTQIGKGLKFFNRRIECATCHDVHNEQVADIKLLRKPLAGSEICLTCHPK